MPKKSRKKTVKKRVGRSSKKKKAPKSEFLEFKGFLSFLILHEVSIKPLAGDDLAKKIGARRGAALTPGTIYPALKKLRNYKLIRYKKFGRKKVYELTDLGSKELKSLYVLFSKYFYGLKMYIKRENQ